MMRLSLLAAIVFFAASSGAEAKWITLASAMRANGTNSSTAYHARVAPGQPLANDTSSFAGGPVISTQYYLAGAADGTLQVYKTTQDFNGGRSTERSPIVLAKREDGSTLFRFIALGTGTEYTLEIRPRPDGTFTVTPAGRPVSR